MQRRTNLEYLRIHDQEEDEPLYRLNGVHHRAVSKLRTIRNNNLAFYTISIISRATLFRKVVVVVLRLSHRAEGRNDSRYGRNALSLVM